MNHLFQIYGIGAKHEIVSYGTNIYVLHNEMFYDGKLIFEQEYTDILLIFDIEPQDSLFFADKISAMINYFVESTNMGKLYLNYLYRTLA